MLRVWHESALPETLRAMTREVTISETSSTLGVLRLTETNLPAEPQEPLRPWNTIRRRRTSPAYSQPRERADARSSEDG